MNPQEKILKLYKFFTGIVFNIAIVILLFSLFVGLGRTIMELGFVFTEETVRLSIKELVTNVLSIVILLELVRAFVDYFEHERVRIEILIEIAIAFMIREFMIYIFAGNIKGTDVIFWTLGIALLVGARTITVIYKPTK
ncbi:phosphate-starvation-inducible PsiE family protein [Hydrogenobacter sp. T-2]|uniref:phosphate-starvation-inducible PsiE family protein n=1 Tax=Pampinifervens diazotrophicum TaxID=1632018 RepID=UPI002B25A65A|nr:phosphate-starvation-inducible PsiE family protein [Hydrogenobacter sp. T-2]WPM32284.1 phosphate-starvation-inducible PsiE family protein [Hydrogenobacter sp. T-2]